jgi:hypothetical protein
VVARQSAGVVTINGGQTKQLVTNNTVAYQHVSRHRVVTTGVVQYRAVLPRCTWADTGAEANSHARGRVSWVTRPSTAIWRCCRACPPATLHRHCRRTA